MNAVQFGNSQIQYKVIRSNRRKTVSLSVGLDGVTVRCPKRMSTNEIQKIVHSKSRWIRTKQLKLREINSKSPKITFLHRSKIPYLGKYYPLMIKKTDGRDNLLLERGRFICNLTAEERSSKERLVASLYDAWLKERGSKIIAKRASLYEDKVGVKASKIIVKNQMKRWGSVGKKSQVNINWKVLQAPMRVIDYVVVHELCHLRIPNHSNSYWRLVRSVIPDYESRREWLRINGLSFTD